MNYLNKLLSLGFIDSFDKEQLQTIKMTNLIALFFGVIVGVYSPIIFGLISKVAGVILLFACLLYIFCLWLNSQYKYLAAKIVLALIGNFLVLYFYILLGKESFVHIFFVAGICLPYLLFTNPLEFIYRNIYITLPFCLFIILNFVDFSLIISPITYNKNILNFLFLSANVLNFFIILVIIGYFSKTMRTAQQEVKDLLQKEQEKNKELLRVEETLMENVKELHFIHQVLADANRTQSIKQKFLDTIIEHLPVAVFVKSVKEDYRFSVWNQAAEKMFGLSSETILGKNDYDFFPKEQADFFREYDQRVMEEGKLVDIPEEPISSPQGNLTLHTIKVPIYDENNEPNILLGISENITERKSYLVALKQKNDALQVAEEELRKNIEELQIVRDNLHQLLIEQDKFIALIESSDIFIGLAAMSGKMLFANKAAMRMVGLRREPITNYNLTDCIPEKFHTTYFNDILPTLHKKGTWRGELMIKGIKSNFEYPSDTTVLLVKDRITQEPICIGLIQFDIAEKKLAEAELQMTANLLQRQKIEITKQNEELVATNGVKDRILSIIAHDVRSPLTVIMGFIDLLKDGDLSAEEIKLLVGQLYTACDNTLLMLENLLTWARSQMQGLTIQPTTFSLQVIFEQQYKNFEALLQKKSLQLHLSLHPIELEIRTDRSLLSIILHNLLSNAIKYTKNKGNIVLLGYKKENQIIIQVKDTGVGISPEHLEKLFKIEEHFTTRGTQDEKGTGLGLLLSKELVEKNKGRLQVESIWGEGTTFTITLPA